MEGRRARCAANNGSEPKDGLQSAGRAGRREGSREPKFANLVLMVFYVAERPWWQRTQMRAGLHMSSKPAWSA